MTVKTYIEVSWKETKPLDPDQPQKEPTDKVIRINFNLFDEIAPKTVENFRCLCTGEKGFGYEGSPFHRIIPNFTLHAGDIIRGDGTGGHSIYGPTFEDENFEISHNKAGILSMTTSGPNTNNSQFFILNGSATWLDGRCVAFGEVADPESMSCVQQLEKTGSAPNGDIIVDPKPYISKCGQYT